MDLPPPHLFKYRGFDRGVESGEPYSRDRDIIERNRLWASSPLSFNDPFDCIPAIDLSGTPAECDRFARRLAERHTNGKPRAERRRARSEAIKAFSKGFNISAEESVRAWTDQLYRIGAVCLAERDDNMLMWSYYADSHSGYCLEFSTDAEPLMRAHRVIYSEQRTIFRPLEPDRSELMEQTLLRKAKFWEHEHEWRVLNHPLGNLVFPADALKSVVFGAKIKPKDEQAVRQIIKSRSLDIKLKRANLDHRTFSLSIVEA